MFKLLGLASLGLALATTAQAQTVGGCAWSRVAAQDRQAFLSAYHAGMQSGMAALKAQDPQLEGYLSDCAQRSDVPALWAQVAIGSQAIQDGAASELLAAHITRAQLDDAWRDAPAASRECARANAAKAFGLDGQVCPDPKASLWFLQELRLSPQADRTASVQVLYYIAAKGQEDLDEALIAKFKATAKP
jgi:hypothetical protein